MISSKGQEEALEHGHALEENYLPQARRVSRLFVGVSRLAWSSGKKHLALTTVCVQVARASPAVKRARAASGTSATSTC